MTVSVGAGPVTQDATMTNSAAVNRVDPNFCGAYTITWTPATLPTFMSFTYPTITLVSNNAADAITYPSPISISVTYKLTGYPSIPAVVKTFTVQVLCQVQTLAFTPAFPSTITLQVGINAQPFDQNFMVSKTPNCP